jgi:hypothetical protein
MPVVSHNEWRAHRRAASARRECDGDCTSGASESRANEPSWTK